MRVLLIGATGFLGRHLALALAGAGHQVTAGVRDPAAAAQVLGAGVQLFDLKSDDRALSRAVSRCDAIINLAGRPIATRWTAKARTEIEESRVGLSQRILRAVGAATQRPRAWINASAVGIYGDGGSEILEEDAPIASDYAADLCRRWEEAAMRAETFGVRVVTPRIGLVLGAEGGLLQRLLPSFRVGLGARLGSGRQWTPWIHIDDLMGLMLRALEDERYRGPVNATAPEPVTNDEFTDALARAVGRPAFLRVPAWALRLALGDASRLVLAGQRVFPSKAFDLGFRFTFTSLSHALRDLLDGRGVAIRPVADAPDAEYLRRRRPRYLLEQSTLVDAPLSRVFEFFSRAENLGAITPPGLAFEIRGAPPEQMHPELKIRYRIRLGPIPMPWLTVIEDWRPGARFVDAQHEGPYACWYHEHDFEAQGGRTRMLDRVYYSPPLGPLGRLANWLFVSPMLRRIFAYRARAIAHRFGVVEPS